MEIIEIGNLGKLLFQLEEADKYSFSSVGQLKTSTSLKLSGVESKTSSSFDLNSESWQDPLTDLKYPSRDSPIEQWEKLNSQPSKGSGIGKLKQR